MGKNNKMAIDNYNLMRIMTHMIDPTKVTNFNRTDAELEEFLLFSIVVAGKDSFQQAKKLDEFLYLKPRTLNPFFNIRSLCIDGNLDFALRSVKMGQYNRVGTAFRGVSNFFHKPGSLQNADVNLLSCIKGIGMKTARFFVMHSRPNQWYACLDTHILRWLANKGHAVPKSTPQGNNYLLLEKIFLDYCKQMGKLPHELDLQIWNKSH